VCDSTCSELDQTKCIILSVINQDLSETEICRTKLFDGAEYSFNIIDKSFLVHKVLKVYTNNFNGEFRELTTAMNDNGISRKHNLSKRTTVNSGAILADLLRRKNQAEQIGNSIEIMVTDVASGGAGTIHTCVLFGSGRVKCWGENQAGTLGYGDAINRGNEASDMGSNLPYLDLGTNRNVIQLSAGVLHSCVVLDNGKVKCWGLNGSTAPEEEHGGLGLGDSNHRGDDPNEMGNNLPYVDLGTGRTAKAVSVGHRFSCAILDNDKVKCWGEGDYGGNGIGNTQFIGNQANEMGDNLQYVDLGTGRTAKKIATNVSSVCALLDNDKIKCWGAGGGLAYGSNANIGDDPNEMGDNLPYVDLGTGRTVVDLFEGWSHYCAILDNFKVKCWGTNNQSQLGAGHLNNIGDGANEMGDNLPYVSLY
jgi:alpha-tubulin suppressor-like RCC1 family protein